MFKVGDKIKFKEEVLKKIKENALNESPYVGSMREEALKKDIYQVKQIYEETNCIKIRLKDDSYIWNAHWFEPYEENDKSDDFKYGDMVVLKPEFTPLSEKDHGGGANCFIRLEMENLSVSNKPMEITDIDENVVQGDNCWYYEKEWLQLADEQNTEKKYEDRRKELERKIDELNEEIDKWKYSTNSWFQESKRAWSKYHDINIELANQKQQHNEWKTKVRETQLNKEMKGDK